MKNIVFDVTERNEKGKKVRRNGEIPAVLYGANLDSAKSIKMAKKDMYKLLTYPKSSVFSLNLNGSSEKCIVKELQKDNFGKVMHIDFQHVEKNENIKMKIPVNFIGEGLLESKQLLLEIILPEVELSGHPDDFPEDIECNVENLEFGNKVLAKDLKIPETLKLVTNGDTIVGTIAGNKTEDPEEEEE